MTKTGVRNRGERTSKMYSIHQIMSAVSLVLRSCRPYIWFSDHVGRIFGSQIMSAVSLLSDHVGRIFGSQIMSAVSLVLRSCRLTHSSVLIVSFGIAYLGLLWKNAILKTWTFRMYVVIRNMFFKRLPKGGNRYLSKDRMVAIIGRD